MQYFHYIHIHLYIGRAYFPGWKIWRAVNKAESVIMTQLEELTLQCWKEQPQYSYKLLYWALSCDLKDRESRIRQSSTKSWLKCDFLFHWLLLSSGRRKVQNKVNFGQNRNKLEQPIVFNNVGERPLVISCSIRFTTGYNIVTQSLQQTTKNEWLTVAEQLYLEYLRSQCKATVLIKKKKRFSDILAISTTHRVQMPNSACPPVSYKLLLQHL